MDQDAPNQNFFSKSPVAAVALLRVPVVRLSQGHIINPRAQLAGLPIAQISTGDFRLSTNTQDHFGVDLLTVRNQVD